MVADFLALRRPSRHPYPFHLRISASSTASLGGQCQPAAGQPSLSERAGIGPAREQLIAVDQIEQRHRLLA